MTFSAHHAKIPPPKPPEQRPQPAIDNTKELLEADHLIRATEGRSRFFVTGSGLTAAVLDTGINARHVDFAQGERVVAQHNFTDETDADINGHGTNVAGIIAAGADHIGIAPGANLAALKVLSNSGGSFAAIVDALGWVLEHQAEHNISVVCMSLGDERNYHDDLQFMHEAVRDRFLALREKRIAVTVASGNRYFKFARQGMGFPAILRECISVGAVYDANVGSEFYEDGAAAFSTAEDRITPFSQRLHPSANGDCYTSIFAPGAPIRSSGIDGPNGESTQQGTSQAAPMIAGAVLLLQELYLRKMQRLPPIVDLVRILRASAADITDGDDEQDNVEHTELVYKRVDVLAALQTMTETIEHGAAQPSAMSSVSSVSSVSSASSHGAAKRAAR